MLWLGQEDCRTTWEPAERVPQVVIDEFESGTTVAVTDQTTSGVGHTVHTLTISRSQSHSIAIPCNPSVHRPVIKESEG